MENSKVDFNNFKFRCSSLGHLLTEPRLKTDKDAGNLSEGCKTYLKQLHCEELFGRSEEIKSKYLDKGIQNEEKSFTLYSNLTKDFSGSYKNTKTFENEFIKGTPDNCKDKILDIKSSWNQKTFPLYETEIENKNYIAQLQGYMALTGLDTAKLVYCLTDTPTKLINDELRRLDWKLDIMDGDGNIRENSIELVVELIKNMIFSFNGLEEYCEENPAVKLEWFTNFKEIPLQFRVKIFNLERNDAMIDFIYSKVKKSREYMNELSLILANQL
jgi:hypothetical protein